jgi:hypothetical protein
MELLDRYLQAVKKHLPWKRQDDILAELRANLEAQLEDKEAALGRPLTQGEAEDWLRQIGPPMRVAARYQPQQYLIGSSFFPTYWFVLRLAFMWSMIIYAIVNAVLIATQTPNGNAILEAVLRVPGILMTVAAWVTLIFAVIEFAAAHYPAKCEELTGVSRGKFSSMNWLPGFSDDWTPSTLPPLEKEAADGEKPRSYAHAVAEVIFGFIFLIWLLLIPRYPYLLMGPGAYYLRSSPFQLAPFWVAFYWSVVALNVLQLVWRSVNLVRGAWQKSRRLEHIVMSAFGLIPLGLVLNVREQVYVTLQHPALDQARYGATVDAINKGIHLSASIVCAIAVLTLAWEIGQMSVGSYRKRA